MNDDSPSPEEMRPGKTGPGEPARLRWWQRVVPVAGLSLVALALAVAFLPRLDDQVELSTQRTAQPFVELFMVTRPASFCGKVRAKVRFRLKSHLAGTQVLTYVVATKPRGHGKVHRRTRKLTISPGEERTRQLRVTAPANGPYNVTVRLANRPEMLRVHCAGGRS